MSKAHPKKCVPPTLETPFSADEACQAQGAWANDLGIPVEITNSIGMQFRLIPPGGFMMGGDAPPDRMTELFAKFDAKPYWFADELPAHRVRITRPFMIGTFPVRSLDFRNFVSATGYTTDAERNGVGGWGYDSNRLLFCQDTRFNWQFVGRPCHDHHPVVNVSWNDALAFVEWLARYDGSVYRLLTEAEWEYACRAGTTTWYYNGNDTERLSLIAHCCDGTWNKVLENGQPLLSEPEFTSPVGQLAANAFGLYDMSGNVFEWLADWYDGDYYQKSVAEDPLCASPASYRACRGGSWLADPAHCRSAHRYGCPPSDCSFTIGFRVAYIPAHRFDRD